MFRSKPVRLLFLLFSLAATAAPASGIYRSVDAQGRVTYSDTPAANAQPVIITGQPSRQLHQVARVYDGDTIILEGRKQVRLLGVNTPEIESRHRSEEPGGSCRKKMAAKSVAGQSGLSGI